MSSSQPILIFLTINNLIMGVFTEEKRGKNFLFRLFSCLLVRGGDLQNVFKC